MDMQLTADEVAFRKEVRSFIRSALPTQIRDKVAAGGYGSRDEMIEWTRILHAKGWSVPHWPVQWGGTGWSPMQLAIFDDEIQLANAPQPLAFGVNMLGPVLYTFGNEAQKARFLPRIANLDDWWCQGFSEPGAGSDLASLKTSARLEGNAYIVNGQKTWTTLAQYAEWIFCLVRTDPESLQPGRKKQEGISFLLIDMKTKGITVRPIQTIDGGVEVNEVFFDDVRVPVENLVGQENRGWDYAKFLLGNERNGIARTGATKEKLRRIRQLAQNGYEGGPPRAHDRRFMEKLTAAEIELRALEITQWRVLARVAKNPKGKPDPASSILKIKGSQMQQCATELLLEMAGPYAMVRKSSASDAHNQPPVGPEWAAVTAPQYFNYRKVSIYGGSNEIQRNIIAKAILGF
ncbi:MAG: pimeloyl-CoA dehydrogenase large subunit [Hyphomicrobiales bacterium]|nr:pimeloyl-CoA dehydrogenase large subunit [Hyphomicrobiales bacterium]MDE2115239.1 pimeloyl-CoA dehydrogenase large subunit [Hyphomicrobiales bacterium]